MSDIRWPDGTAEPDGTEAREPDVTYDGKTMATRLLKPGPPGDRPDPRLEGRWRPAA